jgi:hypothetical protein
MNMSAQDPGSRCLGALANPHRRVVLYYLREHERASLDALAACVAGWTASGPGTGPTTEAETVRAALHHVHLPKLANAGLITYDAEARCATLEPLSPTADRLLSVALDADVGEESVEHLFAGTDS